MEYAEKPKLPSDDKLMDMNLWSIKDNREKACQILKALEGLNIWQAEDLLKECGEFIRFLVIR